MSSSRSCSRPIASIPTINSAGASVSRPSVWSPRPSATTCATDERGLRHLEKIGAQVHACNRIVTALLELARSRPPRFAQIDLRVLLNASLSMLSIPDHVKVDIEVEDPAIVEGDGGLLEQVVVNLITNSIAALAGRAGRISARAHRHDHRFCALVVCDDGPGFDPELLPQVFEPLVTTRASGVGLGLALVKSVTDRHGGVASAENAPGGGAVVRVLLPWRAPTTAA
jgi:signal transduction histidine kinase